MECLCYLYCSILFVYSPKNSKNLFKFALKKRQQNFKWTRQNDSDGRKSQCFTLAEQLDITADVNESLSCQWSQLNSLVELPWLHSSVIGQCQEDSLSSFYSPELELARAVWGSSIVRALCYWPRHQVLSTVETPTPISWPEERTETIFGPLLKAELEQLEKLLQTAPAAPELNEIIDATSVLNPEVTVSEPVATFDGKPEDLVHSKLPVIQPVPLSNGVQHKESVFVRLTNRIKVSHKFTISLSLVITNLYIKSEFLNSAVETLCNSLFLDNDLNWTIELIAVAWAEYVAKWSVFRRIESTLQATGGRHAEDAESHHAGRTFFLSRHHFASSCALTVVWGVSIHRRLWMKLCGASQRRRSISKWRWSIYRARSMSWICRRIHWTKRISPCAPRFKSFQISDILFFVFFLIERLKNWKMKLTLFLFGWMCCRLLRDTCSWWWWK